MSASPVTPAPRDPASLETRLARLASEKAVLELVVRLMGRVSAATEVEVLARDLLEGLMDVIGGTNLTLAWRSGGGWEVADVLGRRERRATLGDPGLEAALAQGAPAELPGTAEGDVGQSGSFTWLVPLAVGGEVVGALRLEDVGLSMRELEAYLPTFFAHAALALRSAVSRAVELERAHTQLRDEATRRARAQRRSRYARSLFEANLDPLVAIGPEGQLTDVNQAMEEMTGLSRDRLLGTRFARHFTQPEKAEAFHQQVLELGSVRNVPLRLRGADGQVTEVSFNASLYRDERGEPQGVIAAARDLTERRVADEVRRQLLARTARAERAAAVGTLAAGMAHEVNNPLTYVLSGLAFAQAQLRALPPEVQRAWEAAGGEPGEAATALEEALEGAGRVRDLVEDLRHLDAAQHDPGAKAQLERALEQAARVARHALAPGAAVALDLLPLPPVPGTEAELVQLFACLLVNAGQAVRESGGEVRVTAALEGDQVATRVVDTGPGIPPEELTRVFDPFFTTRRVGTGRGLGLPVARSIAVGLGGSLEVQSTPGRGTTVTVVLPVSPASEGRVTPPGAPRPRAGSR
jgi:PAS domain S-box-containing protein